MIKIILLIETIVIENLYKGHFTYRMTKGQGSEKRRQELYHINQPLHDRGRRAPYSSLF
jgi:hypothetical protein